MEFFKDVRLSVAKLNDISLGLDEIARQSCLEESRIAAQQLFVKCKLLSFTVFVNLDCDEAVLVAFAKRSLTTCWHSDRMGMDVTCWSICRRCARLNVI